MTAEHTRRSKAFRDQHKSASFSPTLVLASLVCAVTGAFVVYGVVDGKPRYTDLISGSLAWNDTAKTRDYALSLGGIALFGLFYAFMVWLSRHVRVRGGMGALRGFHHVLLLSLSPVCLSLALMLFSDSRDLSLFWASSVLIVVCVVLCGRMTRRRWALASIPRTVDVLGAAVAAIPLGAATGLGLFVFATRVLNPWNTYTTDVLWGFVLGGAGAALVMMVILTGGPRDGDPVVPPIKKLSFGVILAQLGLPLMFAMLVPPRPLDESQWWSGEVLSPVFWTTLWCLIAAGYIDLGRRMFGVFRRQSHGVAWAVSPVCLLAALSYLAVNPPGTPTLLKDDYHWGEFLVPYWSLKDLGWIPFADYTPARGLINYFPGLVADIFADGTAGSFTSTAPITALAYHALALGVFVRFCGRGVGFVVALALPVTGAAEAQILVACMLVVLAWGAWRWRPEAWLVCWVVLGTVLVLLVPAEGGVCVLATMPLGLHRTIVAVRGDARRLFIVLGVAGTAALFVALVTPLGTMVLGAVRYGLEQSRVNTVAHARAWSESAALDGLPWKLGPWRMPMPYAFWEVMRAGFPVVAALCGVVAWHASRHRSGPRRTLAVSFGIAACLYLCLMTFRSLGRIDTGSPSRTVLATLFGVAAALPILIRFTAPAAWRIPLTLCVFPFALLVGLASGAKLSPPQVLPWRALVRQHQRPVLDGEQIGAPGLGRLMAPEDRTEDMRTLSRALGFVLNEGEGYVDLTNRSAMHFFLERPPGLIASSSYNTVHRGQQQRAVRKIHRRGLSAAVAHPDRGLHWDGGGPSLRSPLLWRYVVQRFVPAKIEGWWILVDPSRVDRVPKHADIATDATERLAMLETAFPVRPLHKLPIAWGRSAESLLTGHAFVVVARPVVRPVHGLEEVVGDPGVWRVGSAPVVLEVDLGADGQRGREAGLLILSVQLPPGVEASASIGWSSDIRAEPGHGGPAERTRLTCAIRTGPHIIPLDASADWLLGRAGRITVRIDNLPIGSELGPVTAALGQRAGAAAVDALAAEER